jgi:hypothetical protein
MSEPMSDQSAIPCIQIGCQPKQLIVWLGLQPRSQLIKMLAIGNADEQMVGALP